MNVRSVQGAFLGHPEGILAQFWLLILAVCTVKAEEFSNILPVTFAGPNEYHNYLQLNDANQSRFTQKTAIVSVGTVRTFNAWAVLRRDRLVAFDIAAGVERLNHVLADMIVTNPRQEFLAELLGYETLPYPIHTHVEFATLLEEARQKGLQPRGRLARALESTNNSFSSFRGEFGGYGRSAEAYGATFFASDTHYEFVQKGIREGRFETIVGDLADKKILSKLGTRLKREGYVVSELDISNALDYIGGSDAQLQFLKNARALPHATDSRVLHTVSPSKIASLSLDTSMIPHDGRWGYLAPTFQEFLSDLDRNIFDFYRLEVRTYRDRCAARVK